MLLLLKFECGWCNSLELCSWVMICYYYAFNGLVAIGFMLSCRFCWVGCVAIDLRMFVHLYDYACVLIIDCGYFDGGLLG